MKHEPSGQLYLFQPVEILPRGDGSYVLKPGKPQQWLWVAEAAELMRISPDAVREWIAKGLVVSRRCGLRKFQVEAESLRKYLEPYNHLK